MNETNNKIDLFLIEREIRHYQQYRFWSVISTFITAGCMLGFITMYQFHTRIPGVHDFDSNQFDLTVLISILGGLLAFSIVLIVAFNIQINDHQETIQNEKTKAQINN